MGQLASMTKKTPLSSFDFTGGQPWVHPTGAKRNEMGSQFFSAICFFGTYVFLMLMFILIFGTMSRSLRATSSTLLVEDSENI